MQSSQRAHPRFAHTATVSIFFDGSVVTGTSANLSKGGLCGSFDGPIAAGRDVELDLSLVFDAQGESEPLRLTARVAWCTSLDGIFQIGLSFRAIDVARARYLQVFMKFLDARPVKAIDAGEPSSDPSEPLLADDDVFAPSYKKKPY